MAFAEEWLAGRDGDWTDWRSRATFPSRAQVLELAVQLARPVTGHIIEFGVWKGYSTRVIRDELWRSGLWVGPVSLAHLDADLYSSTACALEWVTPLLHAGSLLLFDEFLGEDPAEARAFVEWTRRTGTRTALIALFGREPSGKGDMTDRRALFQVVGGEQLRKAPPLLPVRLRRRLSARW